MVNYPLPSDTTAAFRGFTRCQNPGLLFERYSPDLRSGDHLKKPTLEKVQQCKPDRQVLAAYRARWRAMTTAAGAKPFEAKTDWRFITGLGRKGPLEVGFAFHRIYGFPIIPGSGLKGVARAWAHFALDNPEQDPDFIAVFGRTPGPGEDESVANAGGAIFFESIPADSPNLDLDVMNPHYPDYYGGKKAPDDGQNPKPVFFLTVRPGVRFAFAVGWRVPLDSEAQRLRQLAEQWLVKGLTELGAGAKTSAGYGYFTTPPIKKPVTEASLQKIEPIAKEPVAQDPIIVRQGVITLIRPDKHFGKVRDLKTNEVYRFSTKVIEGNTPGKKSKVVFWLQGKHVVKVRRL